jgi:hypothetical protein
MSLSAGSCDRVRSAGLGSSHLGLTSLGLEVPVRRENDKDAPISWSIRFQIRVLPKNVGETVLRVFLVRADCFDPQLDGLPGQHVSA